MEDIKKNKDNTWDIPKGLFRDEKNRYITQGLFLEFGYNTNLAVFTLDDEDKNYKGKIYPSLKKLYLNHEDPLEYDFAITYLANWDHWKRLLDNKIIRNHIDRWRDELELQIRAYAIKNVIDMVGTKDNFQAAKWLASRGWEQRGAGRPSKADMEHHKEMNARLAEEFADDIADFQKYKNNKGK